MKMNQMNSLIINSPWPFMLTLNTASMFLNLMMKLNNNNMITKTAIMFMVLVTMLVTMWFSNTNKEKLMTGMLSNYNEMSMKSLIILIMSTESMFFLTFFYINLSMTYFNNSMFNFKFYLTMFKLNFILSFTNLVILLTSSMTLMMSMENKFKKINKSISFLFLTMMLGSYFVLIQLMEYSMLNFNLSNSILFSNFFVLTLFHMTHVIMGILIIMYMTKMKMKYLLSFKIKMKMMCWYWHFVDLIWILIFFLIYMK
uniref:Cytochrome c oxidase subunit 3 n=1 Tax=Didesmococcus koreanus TaxID=1661411 RepID=A0A891GWS8_9HEMI|nr:cytochrome c oxidase subunit III [Didesmococcus koreanus]QRK27454.1 cytochrome c oxidase subunit III [Didesmococcus koreanus]